MQQVEKNEVEKAVDALEYLLNEIASSLKSGKARTSLSHEDAIDLAVEIGAVRTMVKLAKRAGGQRTAESLNALLMVWDVKYKSINGEYAHG